MRRSRASSPPTEALHPLSEGLDLAPVAEVVRRLHEEDQAAVRAVGRALPEVAQAAEAVAAALREGGRLLYVGAGSSGRLGLLDAAECPPTFGTAPRQVSAILAGGRAAMGRAVEGAEDDSRGGAASIRSARVGPRDVVCGISASSATPFVLGALREARALGATTLLVSCNPREAARVPADLAIVAETGPELIAGSTRLKAGTATKLILNAISTAAMVALGKVYRGRMIDLAPTNRKLLARARRMVSELTGLGASASARLLGRAGGQPRVAVAMHLTGLSRIQAERRLRQLGLRGLESAKR